MWKTIFLLVVLSIINFTFAIGEHPLVFKKKTVNKDTVSFIIYDTATDSAVIFKMVELKPPNTLKLLLKTKKDSLSLNTFKRISSSLDFNNRNLVFLNDKDSTARNVIFLFTYLFEKSDQPKIFLPEKSYFFSLSGTIKNLEELQNGSNDADSFSSTLYQTQSDIIKFIKVLMIIMIIMFLIIITMNVWIFFRIRNSDKLVSKKETEIELKTGDGENQGKIIDKINDLFIEHFYIEKDQQNPWLQRLSSNINKSNEKIETAIKDVNNKINDYTDKTIQSDSIIGEIAQKLNTLSGKINEFEKKLDEITKNQSGQSEIKSPKGPLI